jgi:ATP-dependent Lhr-like helicase
MRSVYEETAVPRYLDAKASELLSQGRQEFHRLGLHEQQILCCDGNALFFPWIGDRITNTLSMQLQSLELTVQITGSLSKSTQAQWRICIVNYGGWLTPVRLTLSRLPGLS